MNRKQAKQLLCRKFEWRWGKGDHILFYQGDRLIYGLSVSSGSNHKGLPRGEVKKIRNLLSQKNENLEDQTGLPSRIHQRTTGAQDLHPSGVQPR